MIKLLFIDNQLNMINLKVNIQNKNQKYLNQKKGIKKDKFMQKQHLLKLTNILKNLDD